MKRKIIIFVTLLFVVLAFNGFAHNRHHKNFRKNHQRMETKHCPNYPQMNRENKDFKFENFRENRPNKEFKFKNHRKGHPVHENSVTVVKDTLNGKTAMVTVESPLNVLQLQHLQLLN